MVDGVPLFKTVALPPSSSKCVTEGSHCRPNQWMKCLSLLTVTAESGNNSRPLPKQSSQADSAQPSIVYQLGSNTAEAKQCPRIKLWALVAARQLKPTELSQVSNLSPAFLLHALLLNNSNKLFCNVSLTLCTLLPAWRKCTKKEAIVSCDSSFCYLYLF